MNSSTGSRVVLTAWVLALMLHSVRPDRSIAPPPVKVVINAMVVYGLLSLLARSAPALASTFAAGTIMVQVLGKTGQAARQRTSTRAPAPVLESGGGAAETRE